MSDNGANGAVSSTYPGNADGKYLSTFNNAQANRGLKGSYVEMGPGWAMASSIPFRYFKTFTTEGGIKAPLIVKVPKLQGSGKWIKSLVHVTDIMPTLLEFTDTSYPAEHNGTPIHGHIGQSILPILKGQIAEIHDQNGIGYELFEMKAYLKGNWKILRLPVPMGTGNWELFDLSKDPGETTDLSSSFPELREQLINDWNDYATLNNVYDHNGHYDSIYRKSFQGTSN
jgi:arylsulfatase